MSAFEMAQVYYPRLWDESRLTALVAAGKLTKKEADQIRQEKSPAQNEVTA